MITIFDRLIAEWSAKAREHRLSQGECAEEEPEEAALHDLEASVFEGCISDLQAALTPTPAPHAGIQF